MYTGIVLSTDHKQHYELICAMVMHIRKHASSKQCFIACIPPSGFTFCLKWLLFDLPRALRVLINASFRDEYPFTYSWHFDHLLASTLTATHYRYNLLYPSRGHLRSMGRGTIFRRQIDIMTIQQENSSLCDSPSIKFWIGFTKLDKSFFLHNRPQI